MANMLYWSTKCMNAEDTMIAKGGGLKKREKHDDPYLNRGRKVARTNNKRDEWRSRPLPRQIAYFTPLNTPLDKVLM